jgi:hypothetical protein
MLQQTKQRQQQQQQQLPRNTTRNTPQNTHEVPYPAGIVDSRDAEPEAPQPNQKSTRQGPHQPKQRSDQTITTNTTGKETIDNKKHTPLKDKTTLK